MSKAKELMSDDTIIVKKPIPLDDSFPLKDYNRYFKHVLGKSFTGYMDNGNTTFVTWLASQAGKTLKEAAEEWTLQVEESTRLPEPANIEEMLSRRKFNFVPDTSKAFILAFDEEMQRIGYDYGGIVDTGYGWGIFMVVYGKTGTKSRPVAARIYIRANGELVLRLFLNKIDTHRQYIENAPPFIKDVFTNEHGYCFGCNLVDGKCKFKAEKIYTIDGKLIQKCSNQVFEFHGLTLERLPDYMGLISKFYVKK